MRHITCHASEHSVTPASKRLPARVPICLIASMTTPSLPTLKALFARSKNLCAFPGCMTPIAEDNGTVTGEVCHICALSAGGPRYDPDQTSSERNAAGNLILMCGRHHKIIDSEVQTYTVARLRSIKRSHEEKGIAEISPLAARVAAQLQASCGDVSIVGNTGHVAVQSPGAMQAQTINVNNTFKNSRPKGLSVQAPPASIGASQPKVAYCQHLIIRYQDYQKGDKTGKGEYKYMALHNALKREFGTEWKLLGEDRFEDVVAYLQRRIDNTFIGRLNGSKGRRNYSSFEEWPG